MSTNFPNGIELAGVLVTSTAAELNILDGVTANAAELSILSGVTAAAAELNYLDLTTLGTMTASKVLSADASNIATLGGTVDLTGVFQIGSVTVSSTAAELNLLDTLVAEDLGRQIISVPITAVANVTTTTAAFVVTRGMTVKAISVAFHTKPASSSGAVTLAVTNYDLGATTDDNLLSTSTVDLEALTDKTASDLTLTVTGPDLDLADGDFVFCQVVSDNVDMTAGLGGVLTFEVEIT